MNFRYLAILMSIFLFLSGCSDSQQVDGYQPDEDAPTHEAMFEELFGIPKDSNTVGEVFSNANPHPYLRAALSILWFMALASFAVIVAVGGIKSVFNAPQSQSILGSDISTPIAPVRIGLAFLLLIAIPDGKHYSLIESIILSANKFVSNQANNLFIDTSDVIRVSTDDINPDAISLKVSREAVYRVFTMAMCEKFLLDKGLRDKLTKKTVQQDIEYNDGSSFITAMGVRYNVKLSEWFFSRDKPIEGGCGQWYISTMPPGGVKEEPINLITQLTQGIDISTAVGAQLNALRTLTFIRTNNLYVSLSGLAEDMVEYHKTSPEDVDEAYQEFLARFDIIFKEYNDILTVYAQNAVRAILSIGYVDLINENALDSGVKNGWFFGGALPLMYAKSADKYLMFEQVKLNTSIPIPGAFVKKYREDLGEYLGYGESVLGSFSSTLNSGMIPIADLNYSTSFIECAGVSLTDSYNCMSEVVIGDTLELTRALSSGSVNPLTLIHNIGKSGTHDTFATVVKLNASYAALAAGGGILQWVPVLGGGLEAAATVFKVVVDSVTPILNSLMALYTFLGYGITLLIYAYYLVAIVAYMVLLFVALFGANFFAVSHAWLEGQGFVSSYAQRGYPSLLFSALTPLLIVMGFFVFMMLLPFAYQLLGWTYSLFLTPFATDVSPSLFGSILLFFSLIFFMTVTARVLAKLILDIPDRVMRLIGVHEALATSDFSGEIGGNMKGNTEQTSKSSTGAVGGATQAGLGRSGEMSHGSGYVDAGGNEVSKEDAKSSDTNNSPRSKDSNESSSTNRSPGTDSDSNIHTGETTGDENKDGSGGAGGSGGGAARYTKVSSKGGSGLLGAVSSGQASMSTNANRNAAVDSLNQGDRNDDSSGGSSGGSAGSRTDDSQPSGNTGVNLNNDDVLAAEDNEQSIRNNAKGNTLESEKVADPSYDKLTDTERNNEDDIYSSEKSNKSQRDTSEDKQNKDNDGGSKNPVQGGPDKQIDKYGNIDPVD